MASRLWRLRITNTFSAVDLVIDSVAALTPRAEIERMGDSRMGFTSKINESALRKLTEY